MNEKNKSNKQLAAELDEARRQIEELKTVASKNKETENALKESEARYRVLFETSPDPIVMYDLRGDFIMVNQQTATTYGVSDPEAFMTKYKNVMETLVDTNRIQAKARVEDLLQDKAGPKNAYKLFTHDGDYFIGEVNTSIIKDHNDNPKAFISIVHDVTQNRHMEEALLESERKYRLLAENAHDVIFTMNDNLRFTYVSPSITHLRGFSVEEAMSLPLEEVLTPASLEVALKAYQNETANEGKETKDLERTHILELEMRRKDGSTVWTETTLSLLYDERNHFTGILGITRDISERKRVEDELRQIKIAIDSSSDAIGMATAQGLHFYQNEAYSKMFGYTVEEIARRPLSSPFKNKRLGKDVLEAIMSGNSWQGEVEMIAKDGRCIPILLRADAVKDAQGKIISLISVHTDISERKKAEERLIQSEKQYRTLVDNMQDVIYRADDNGTIVYISPSAPQMLGCDSTEEMIGLNIADDFYYYPEDRQKFLEALKKQGKVKNYEVTLKRRDNGKPVFVSTNSQFYYDKDGTIIGIDGVLNDISERKRVEEEKKKLEAQLYQAQKMESLGTLAGGIAHDFNNILAAIIGYSELALENISGHEKAKAEIREVLKAGDRAKNLVSQILTFSRQTKLTYSPLEFPTLIKESLKMLRSVIPTSIEIRRDLIPSGLIMSDPTQMHQLIMNFCTNAAHAMDEAGGVLSISLQKVHIEIKTARHLDISPGRYLQLSVSDTGPGIPPEIMKRIFEPYYTTKELGRGTGLGLSVVHGIVKSHGGAITCKSTPGEGTTFDVYLPELELGMEALESKQEDTYPRGAERILYVDDEPALANLAEKILGGLGYKVTTATSSLEAFEIFKARPDSFDLVITDMTMPGMTGDKLAQKFMEIRSGIRVILCSGYSEHISAEKAESIGIRKFIMKPIQKKTMAETIREVLDT